MKVATNGSGVGDYQKNVSVDGRLTKPEVTAEQETTDQSLWSCALVNC